MASFIFDSFSRNLLILQIWGLYIPENYNKLYKIYGILMYSIFIVPVPVLGALNLFFEKDIDIVAVADNVFLVSEVFCFIPKVLPFITSARQIKKCILFLEKPIFLKYVRNEKQSDILKKCQSTCRRNNAMFLCFVLGSLISWSLKPFFWTEYRFPVDVWLPFNAFDSLVKYYIMLFYITISVVYEAISSAMIDPLLSGLALQAVGQFQILKDNLQFLDEYAQIEIDNSRMIGMTKNEVIQQQIYECVKHHCAILEFLNLYEKSFSTVVFSQFLGSIFAICVSCLQLSMVEPFTLNFISMIIFLNTMLVEIYLYCYYGTVLYYESNTLTDSIYMGNWYNYDINCKKTLILIMERSKKPVIITAGKLLDLSLDTFTMIIRRSYSLLAVLKNY